MKTEKEINVMKTKNIETWLPVFSGFYDTIWETDRDEESELEYINEQRAEKNLAPITWDDVEWDYKSYHEDVAKGVTRWIGKALKEDGFISDYAFQELRSPREYNFANDAINVEFVLTSANREAIRIYLEKNREKFKEYIEGRYSSRSGFISYYSNNGSDWLIDLDDALDHKHKLGAILNFILENEDKELEMKIYEDLSGNGVTLRAKNYNVLTEGK